MINAWLAIPLATAQDIREAYPDLPERAQEALQQMREGFWLNVTVGGTTYKIFDVLVPAKYVIKLTDKWPDIVILGAWDKNGKVLKPLHPKILDVLPDDVTYDAQGNEISRTRLAVFKEPHRWFGWEDRETS